MDFLGVRGMVQTLDAELLSGTLSSLARRRVCRPERPGSFFYGSSSDSWGYEIDNRCLIIDGDIYIY
jgi:hypothetical protein